MKMTTQTKALIATSATALGAVVLLYGLNTIVSSRSVGGWRGVGCLFAGFAIGTIATVYMKYYHAANRTHVAQSDQVALETLNNLAKQRRKVR